MGLFNDTVTIYKKQADGSYLISVVQGVQWSDIIDKRMESGRLTTSKSANITFPESTLSKVDLATYTEEDAILYGDVREDITAERGHRLSDLLAAHPKSGIIRTVRDNSNRSFLKNIKAVVY